MAVKANKAEGFASRTQRLPGKHKVVNKVDRRAMLRALADEASIANRWIVPVGNKISLGSPPNEYRWCTKLEGNGAAKGPRALVAGRDGVPCGDGPRKLVDNEAKSAGRPSTRFTLVKPRPARPSRSRISNSSDAHRMTMSEIVGGSVIRSCSDTSCSTAFLGLLSSSADYPLSPYGKPAERTHGNVALTGLN